MQRQYTPLSPDRGNGADCLSILAERGIFPAKVQLHKTKDAYLFHCPLPGHQDTDPSFSLHLDRKRFICWPCGESGGPKKLLELLDGPAITPLPKDSKPPTKPAKRRDEQWQGCTLQQLADAKNLPIDHLRSLGWHDTTY